MALDLRVLKTKRNFKDTLLDLLKNTPFDKITVSQLCRQGVASRITFYTYYKDKYALVEEVLQDFAQEAIEDYHRLQAQNNPQRHAFLGYRNMLDCILNLYYNHSELFNLSIGQKNPYLYSAFFRYIFENVENYIELHRATMTPRYSARQTAALLCNGIWGVINECYQSRLPREQIYNDVHGMYRDILQSNLFIIHGPLPEETKG